MNMRWQLYFKAIVTVFWTVFDNLFIQSTSYQRLGYLNHKIYTTALFFITK